MRGYRMMSGGHLDNAVAIYCVACGVDQSINQSAAEPTQLSRPSRTGREVMTTHSIIDHFEYRTIDARLNSNNTIKCIAYCYGDLGAFRIDTLLRSINSKDGLLSVSELWGVLMLSNGAMFFGCPVFKSLDNVANFIFATNMLTDSWPRVDLTKFRQVKPAVHASVEQFDGFLLGPLLMALDNSERSLQRSPVPV